MSILDKEGYWYILSIYKVYNLCILLISMKTAVINIKIEPKIKERAKKIAANLGFSLSTIINGYLKYFIKTETIHFTSQPEGEPTRYMIRGLKAAEADRKAGRVSPVFYNTKDAITWLNKKDLK